MTRQLPCLFASLLVLLTSFPAPAARAAEPATFEVDAHRDVAYYSGPDADALRHRLDLFVPHGQRDYPVVMVLHGGAWVMGNKSFFGLYSAVGRYLASRGVGVVLPNYRLSPAVKHPEHIRDVARAFAWTRRHIAEYGGSPEKLFVAGHSAGGHLAALLVTDETYLRAEGLTAADVRGVIPISGVYRIPAADLDLLADLNLMLNLPGTPAKAAGRATAWSPFRAAFGDDPKVRRAASPLTHVRPGLPPFLILYAEFDYPTLPQMAEEFHRTLRRQQDESALRKIADRSHNTILFAATRDDDPVARALLEFVTTHAK